MNTIFQISIALSAWLLRCVYVQGFMVVKRQPFGFAMCLQMCEGLVGCYRPRFDVKDLRCGLELFTWWFDEKRKFDVMQISNVTIGIFKRIKTKTKRHKIVSQMQQVTQLHPEDMLYGYKLWRWSGSMTYIKVHYDKMLWTRAHQFCGWEGGSLILLKSDEKRRLFTPPPVAGPIWVGLRDMFGNNRWTWLDGSPQNITVLGPPPPPAPSSQCCCLDSLSKFMNVSCNWPLPFFCEIREQ